MSAGFVDVLLEAVGPGRPWAGVVMRSEFRPAAGEKVFPPSYPVNEREPGASPYLFETRWVGDQERGVVVLDQPPSQANRVEQALLEARDEGRIRLPLFELVADTSRGPLRLTSLEFPHRYADAYLRDSELDGVRFDKTEVGRRLRSASAVDVRPLYEWSPESLLFGAWDSHRKGRAAKFPRVYSSSIIGLDPEEGERRSGRMDPLNLTGAVKDSSQAAGDWEFVAAGEKARGKKLSEAGHGNIAPNPVHGGVTITGALRSGWLSLSGLARLRFGDAPAEAARLARAALAALAIAGDRLAFGAPSVWLRSGCDLVRTDETLAFEPADDGEPEKITLSADEAIDAFHELRDRAAAAGIAMSSETVRLRPIPGLAKAIEYSTTKAADEGE